MARTGHKFFLANQSVGDYHDNFDTKAFFKWQVACQLTYPEFCKHLQRLHDTNKLVPPIPADQSFYDFELDRPTRALIECIDNAPYHHGIAIQLSSKSKPEIIKILQDKGINSVAYDTTNEAGNPMKLHVELGNIAKGKPTLPQLIKAARDALLVKFPQLVTPPYEQLMKNMQGKWGPEGSNSWTVIFTAPYTSTQIPVELHWADGKNHVANPKQYEKGRSSAQVVQHLRNRWYGLNGVKQSSCNDMFDHCNRVIDDFISDDQENDDECPFTGSLENLKGNPDDLSEWRALAGMTVGQDLGDDENDAHFIGEL